MGWRDWTGRGRTALEDGTERAGAAGQTLWDWLQLLIVPAILIGVTFVWSATQTRSDNKREDRRIDADQAAAREARRDATLQVYLDGDERPDARQETAPLQGERCGQGGRSYRHPHRASTLERRAKGRSRALPVRGPAHPRERRGPGSLGGRQPYGRQPQGRHPRGRRPQWRRPHGRQPHARQPLARLPL